MRLKRISACGFLSAWGQADNPQARGCNKLIRQGARLTENFDDVIEEFEFLPGMTVKKKDPENNSADGVGTYKENENTHLTISDDEGRIIALLEKGEAGVDSLSADTGFGTSKILPLLTKMEMKKLVIQLPGKRYSLRKRL